MTRLVLFISLFLVAACSKTETVELPNGYKIWAMNPKEIYLSNAANELVVGFAIANVGVDGDLVVVECVDATPATSPNGYLNQKGYSLVNTSSGSIETGLTLPDVERRALEVGFDLAALKPVSDYF
ncbi:hypothetical protein [Pseudomarimonas arenosa]|uniref:Uncharacterized protein n=1 Tax=Pseudomarimonas arenosa TaxID=2774145 RepID=A0AAW3ZRB5_9GAMM|nr:hypothetical protein [Pseudomarimonas arenosa]MBD8528248.1 hypothetical protein [Pseudomarimonas arenosa]